ncbi:hypothetical protein [Cyanobium sp. ATX-6F1]
MICWEHQGERRQETVPVHQARHRRLEVELMGGIVYWSERL